MRSTAALAIAMLLATPAVVESASLDVLFEPVGPALGIHLTTPADAPEFAPLVMFSPGDLEIAATTEPGPSPAPGQNVFLATAPEPTTALLLGLGLVGLTWTGRPRTKPI
jgi:hypothetical protein